MKINNQVISLFNSNFFIKEDDIVFLVFEICSKLNYKKLIDSYAKEGRPSALPINVMFMVVVYAYMPLTEPVTTAHFLSIISLYSLFRLRLSVISTLPSFLYERAIETA